MKRPGMLNRTTSLDRRNYPRNTDIVADGLDPIYVASFCKTVLTVGAPNRYTVSLQAIKSDSYKADMAAAWDCALAKPCSWSDVTKVKIHRGPDPEKAPWLDIKHLYKGNLVEYVVELPVQDTARKTILDQVAKSSSPCVLHRQRAYIWKDPPTVLNQAGSTHTKIHVKLCGSEDPNSPPVPAPGFLQNCQKPVSIAGSRPRLHLRDVAKPTRLQETHPDVRIAPKTPPELMLNRQAYLNEYKGITGFSFEG